MKIIPQTMQRGRHAVLLLAESPRDEETCRKISAEIARNPAVAATEERAAGDPFYSLRLEELEV